LVVFGNILMIGLLAWKLPIWFPNLRRFRPWFLCYPPFIWTVEFGQDTMLLTLCMAYSDASAQRAARADSTPCSSGRHPCRGAIDPAQADECPIPTPR
jgi:hypothetical protein